MKTIIINNPGPRGPRGVAGASGSDGAPGPPGSISSSAFTSVTASVDALNAATSSYVLVSQTGSMSVATASFISDTFISASAVRSGFGDTTTDISALNIFTGSAQTQIDSLTAATSSYLISLPDNIVSSSAQIATEISGAFASPFTAVGISGSFTNISSSFSTRTTALESNTVFTSTMISGSFTAPSSSFSTRVSTLENNPSVSPGTLSSSAQIATDITGAFGASSASFSTRVTTLEAGGASGFTSAGISGSFTAPSSSFSTRVTTLEAGGGGGSGIFTDSNGFKVTTNNLIVSKSAAKALTSSLSVQGSGSSIFDVQGSAGQLFDVQDGLDGVLMSVNDISGIPILTVSSSGNIIIPNASRLIGTASVALSVPGATSAFPFTGNALITGDLDITGSGSDIFKVRSKSGSLFSVDDGLDGVLMSVNDISGLPLFEISSSGLVTLVSGNITGSATSTASFGHIIGDGSQLSNLPAATLPSGVLSGSAQIASDISGSFTSTSSSLASRTSTLEGAGYITSVFPFTGSAIISGSTELIGPVNITGSTIIFSSGTPGLTVQSNGDVAEETKIYDAKIALEDSGLEQVVIKSNSSTATMFGNITLRAATLAYGFLAAHDWHTNNRISWLSSGIRLGQRLSDPNSSPNQTSPFVLSATGSVGFEGDTQITGSLDITGNISGSATSTASFGTYVGDGSQLTNLPSSFTATSISGSFTESSSSFSTRVTTNATNISTNTSNVSSNLTKINSLTAATASLVAETLSIFRQEGSPAPGTGTTHSIAVTVNDPGGGNKYYLDGELTGSVVMNLGDAYKFDQSDSSNGSGGGHPFRFSTNAGGGSEYSVGVVVAGSPGSAGAYTLISITDATTAPLYYYCTNHAGMGGGILSINSGSLISTGFAKITGSLIVSSSNVDFLQATGVSGSFSGSFAGDGTNLNLASNSTIPSSNPFPFTGDAQITGSLLVTGSLGIIEGEISSSRFFFQGVSDPSLFHIGYGASNSSNTNVVIGPGASATSGGYRNVVIGNSTTVGAGYRSVLIGESINAPINHGVVIGDRADATVLGSISIGSLAGNGVSSQGINIGYQAKGSGVSNIVLNSSYLSVTPTKANAFGIYMTGTSPNFEIEATGSSRLSGSSFTIEKSGSTLFEVIGSEGTIFSLEDDLDGTLFTVNDRSGIPMFEVSASGRIVAEEGEAIIRSQRPIVTVGTNPFTASLDNVGQYFRVGGNVTCSIKVNATASCPVGAEFDFFQTSSAGNLLFEADPGVTINSKNSNLNLAGQFSSATLKCIDTDEWDLMGDLT